MNKSIRKLAAVLSGCILLSCLGTVAAFADSEEPEPMEEAQAQEIHVEIRWEENRGQLQSVTTLSWDPESLCYQKGTPTLDTEHQTPTELTLTMESKTAVAVEYQITFTPAEGVGVQEEKKCSKEGGLVLTPEKPYQVYQSKVYVTAMDSSLLSRNQDTFKIGSYTVMVSAVDFQPLAEESDPEPTSPTEEQSLEQEQIEEEPAGEEIPEEIPAEEATIEERPSEEVPAEEEPIEEQLPEEQPPEEQPPEEEPPEEQPPEEQPSEEMPNADHSS